MYGAGFTVGSLAGKGARGGTGDKVSIDMELMEVGRVAEGDRGGCKEEGCKWRDQIGGCGDFL